MGSVVWFGDVGIHQIPNFPYRPAPIWSFQGRIRKHPGVSDLGWYNSRYGYAGSSS